MAVVNGGASSNTYRLLGILAYCAFLVGLDSLLVSPLIPAMTSTTHTPTHQGGLLVTAYALLYGIFAPLFGPVSDHWGRKKLMTLGLVVLGLGTVATGFGFTFSELLIFRAIAGLGAAMTMPTIFALIGDSFPYEIRGRAMGVVMGAMVGSTVLGVPLGTFLAYLGSWHWTFWVVGFLVVIAIGLVVGKVPANTPNHDIPVNPFTTYRGQFKKAFTNPSVFFALLSTFLWAAGFQGLFAYVGVYYKQNFNLNEAQIGLVILAAGLGSVIGNVLGGRISDRVGKRTVVTFASVVAAAGVVCFSLLTHDLAAAIVAQVIWSTSIGFGQSPLTALVSELSPSVRGTVLSLNSSAMYLGMTTATAAATAILARGGFVRVGIMSGLLSLLVWPTVAFLVKEGLTMRARGKTL